MNLSTFDKLELFSKELQRYMSPQKCCSVLFCSYIIVITYTFTNTSYLATNASNFFFYIL
ncbi:hypothetical protein DN396_24705 [Bacillus sp. BF9-10]|nr:hypothetical protein DN396_24705 [Bacillus sp. BF9-10]